MSYENQMILLGKLNIDRIKKIKKYKDLSFFSMGRRWNYSVLNK